MLIGVLKSSSRQPSFFHPILLDTALPLFFNVLMEMANLKSHKLNSITGKFKFVPITFDADDIQ